MVHYIVTAFYSDGIPVSLDLDALKREYVLFGRGPYHGANSTVKNDLEVPGNVNSVSRAHAYFQKNGENWYIVDDSTSVNGLSINGNQVRSAQLYDGMRIYIGEKGSSGCVLSVSCVQERDNINGFDVSAKMISLQKKSRFTIGRENNCDVVISHPMASRVHAVIDKTDKGYILQDNHSTNGVNLNGIPLRNPTVLNNMDRFTVADVTMVYCDGNLYSTVNKSGVGVKAVNLCKTVHAKQGRKKGIKFIADHINLNINAGEFVSIIGGSGVGKTTLLNCLSGMSNFTSGSVLINNDTLSPGNNTLKGIIGYVPQRDIVYDDLTLQRMLHYSAELRMPKGTTKEEIKKKIDEILDIVDLSAHRDTMIGKLSGGQKKRASIAVELLSDPKLFFLDEPFSGLDPGTEKSLMYTLKKIAESGRTVIMVTHSVLYLSLCSRVICMGRGGRLCYSGSPDKLCETFGVNSVADIFEQLDNNSKALSERERSLATESLDSVKGPGDKPKKSRKGKSSFQQFAILTARYAELTFNRKGRLILILLMPFILSIFVCLAFKMDGGLANSIYNFLDGLGINSSILNRDSYPFRVAGDTISAMLTFSCAAFWIGMFNTIQEISKERSIFDREAFTGVKSLPYVCSKLTVSTVICIFQSAVMTEILFLLANNVLTKGGNTSLQQPELVFEINLPSGGVVFTSSLWLEYFVTTLLTMLSAMCLGLLISSIFSNDMALVICPIALLPQILFANVVSELSGITATISNIITCNWSVQAYCTSVDVYNFTRATTKLVDGKSVDLTSLELYNQGNFYKSINWGTSWEATDFGTLDTQSRYSTNTKPVFDLNPVLSAWVMMAIICVVCIALAVVLMYFKSKPDFSIRNIIRRNAALKDKQKHRKTVTAK